MYTEQELRYARNVIRRIAPEAQDLRGAGSRRDDGGHTRRTGKQQRVGRMGDISLCGSGAYGRRMDSLGGGAGSDAPPMRDCLWRTLWR